MNGAGKSSLAGAAIREAGGAYFNPDEGARALLARHPDLTVAEVNAQAWAHGKRLLERAIRLRDDFTFETTLGGATITRLLGEALDAGLDVRMKFVGLASPELHIARVRARVARGGHDIPEARIRARFESSRRNLVRLLPRLTELLVYDNSDDAAPDGDRPPMPTLVLHVVSGRIQSVMPAASIPAWAKPIVMAALKL